jgi:predicted GH43/DUF377 family glycosyl hydrolase
MYFIAGENMFSFNVATSEDGFNFELTAKQQEIGTRRGGKKSFLPTEKFSFFSTHDGSAPSHKLLFKCSPRYCVADSEDFTSWTYSSFAGGLSSRGIVVSEFKYRNKYVLYGGDSAVSVSYSSDAIKWSSRKKILLESRPDKFDSGELGLENVFVSSKGLLLLYHSKVISHGKISWKVGAALFDSTNPEKLLWRSDEALWDSGKEWGARAVSPIGVVKFRNRLISYWDMEGEGIFAVVYSFLNIHIPTVTSHVSLNLKKPAGNPIISPRAENSWEAFTTFNAGTVKINNEVHILYRAQGYDYVSTVGYARSKDGVNIDERLHYPVYVPRLPFESMSGSPHASPNTDQFASGGGYGGCEDPRVTKVGNRLYMVFVANDGSSLRLALTSISVKDFLAHRWFWERPILISPPGVVDKSGCILPEKINGKYVIFHRVFPDILIDYVDNLQFTGNSWLKGEFRIPAREKMWDSRKIGAGAPPIKTKDGWLLIYYAVDDKDSSKYKIGAMLLDLKDPAKVLHRTNAPILEPTEVYENEGFKPGVTYPCGAVVLGKTLLVYYGGADSVVCVASAPLDHFLSELKHSEIAKLDTAIIKQVL